MCTKYKGSLERELIKSTQIGQDVWLKLCAHKTRQDMVHIYPTVAIRPRAWLLSTEANWHKNDRAKKCENDFFLILN